VCLAHVAKSNDAESDVFECHKGREARRA
jgi:hypothetical protein